MRLCHKSEIRKSGIFLREGIDGVFCPTGVTARPPRTSVRHSGARKREPGIHFAAENAARWIPGLRAAHASRNDGGGEAERNATTSRRERASGPETPARR